MHSFKVNIIICKTCIQKKQLRMNVCITLCDFFFFNVKCNAVTSTLGYVSFDYVYLLYGYAVILNNQLNTPF